MAGLSSRFIKEGFTIPKYMLYAKNKSLFNLSVSSFEAYFDNSKFLFIARDVFCTEEFIEKECLLLGIDNYQIVSLDHPTSGQAETVLLGLKEANLRSNESMLIFNIDTFRFGYKLPNLIDSWDGSLEVFEGSGANWSYAKTEDKNSTRVIKTAEKNEISKYCSTGVYHFKSVSIFLEAYKWMLESRELLMSKELYIAPMYNFLIKKGFEIHISLIKRDEVIFCGVPEEYYGYLKVLE